MYKQVDTGMQGRVVASTGQQFGLLQEHEVQPRPRRTRPSRVVGVGARGRPIRSAHDLAHEATRAFITQHSPLCSASQ